MTDTEKPPTKLIFMDTETNGLDRRIHEVWEVAIIEATHHHGDYLEITGRHEWMVKPCVEAGDPMAYNINHFYERPKTWNNPLQVASEIAELLPGTHLVGAVPDFDAFFVERLLRENGQVPTWHYHLVDIETLIAGRLGIAPPYKSEQLFEAIGLPKEYPGKHTAMGDTQQLVECWQALFFGGLT